MPTSKHGLISEQDVFWKCIQSKLDGLREVYKREAWYIFLHLLRTRRDDINDFLTALRSKIWLWDYRREEEPFLPDKSEQGSPWIEALDEVRRFGNDTKLLTPSLGVAETISICFSAVTLGDMKLLHKLRAIARENS